MSEIGWEPWWRLLLVLAVLAGGLLLVLRWLQQRGQLLNRNHRLQVLGALAVGTRERVVLLEVDGVRVLVGVTPQQITPLWSETPETAKAATQTAPFSHQLHKAMAATASPSGDSLSTEARS